MSAADQAEPMLQRLDALLVHGRALEERARATEREIADLLPQADSDLATAVADERGVLISLTFAPAAAAASAQQIEDAVNTAIGRAVALAGRPGEAIAAAVFAALADGALPRSTEHVTLGGAIRVEAFMGRPGRVHLQRDLLERTPLSAVAAAVVAAHAAAARESASLPPASKE